MAESVLLPSPNWFLSSVAACSSEGYFAYGSRKDIVVVRSVELKEGSPATPIFEIIPTAHRDKVTAVAFANRVFSNCELPSNPLATASEDGAVIIWNVEELEACKRHREHKDKVQCIDWTRKGDLLLVTGDDRGKIVVWDLVADNLRSLSLLNSSRLAPHTLACSPANPDIVAVGCKDGAVCLLNIKGSGNLMHKLRGHDKTVIDLSWCPSSEGAGEAAAPLLASGGLDQKIHIWQPKTGLNIKTIPVPNKQLGGGFKPKPDTNKGPVVWIPLVWLKSTLLVSGSASSELLAWNPMTDKPTPRLIHNEHVRGLACIITQPLKANNADWRAPEESPIIWTIAQDRKMVKSIITTIPEVAQEKGEKDEDNIIPVPVNKTIVFPTLGGYVYFLAPCPFAPGRMAIGVGDETIRIWTMSDTSTTNVTVIWQRIKGKVMTLAWHPEKEGILAFGTSDGRVGICNVSNPNKEPIVFRPYHRSTVYRVTWGPPVYKEGEEPATTDYYVYACDETTAVFYDTKDPQKAPTPLKSIIQATNPSVKLDIKHKELCWKSDYSLLAIGLDDGCVQLYSVPHLRCVHTLVSLKKSVYVLAFHPSCTATDEGLAPQRHWLASSSTDQYVLIFDLAPLVPEEESGDWNSCSLPIEPCFTLKHGNKVGYIAWNPHISGQLVSSSYDKSVKVWDVVKQEVLACYWQHSSCVLACCWSMLDPDVMLSGSADFTVQVWRISKSPPDTALPRHNKIIVMPEQSVTTQTKTEIQTREANKTINSKVDKANTEKKNPATQDLKKARVNLFPVSGPASNKKQQALECCEHLLRTQGLLPPLKVKVEEKQSEDQVVSKEVNNEVAVINSDVSEISKVETQPEAVDNGSKNPEPDSTTPQIKEVSVQDFPNIGYFTSQENAQAMLEADGKSLKTSGNYKGFYNLELWRGNLLDSLKAAVQTKHLDDWLVSLAPNVSHKVWLEMCAVYAEQLIQEEDHLKAASYFLACHKVMEAVNVLRANKLFREAVSICQCRFGPDDPATIETICQWGKFSASQGSFELATQCFIAAKDYENAAVLLSKRKDPKLWKLGAFLAKQAGADSLCMSLASECLFATMMDEDWEAPMDIIKEHPSLEPLQVLMEVHQLVIERNKQELPGAEQLSQMWQDALNPEDSLLEQLILICKNSTQDDLYSKLYKLLPRQHMQQPADSRKELLLQISKLLVLAAAARNEGIDDWERFVVEALHMAYRRGLVCVKERPLQALISWLCCPILSKLSLSERAFKCAAMLDTLSGDSVDSLNLLSKYKSFLFDADCATFTRLTVVITEKEKEVAANQAAKKQTETSQDSLANARNTKEALEKKRIAFPNPLIIYCKIQGLIEAYKQKDLLEPEQIAQWEQDLNDFRAKLQK